MRILLSLHQHQIQKGVNLQVVFFRKPRIKTNCLFGLDATCRTFAPERASVDWWPGWYEGNEVVATMRRCEKEIIAEAVKK